jgi:hypothetical protein
VSVDRKRELRRAHARLLEAAEQVRIALACDDAESNQHAAYAGAAMHQAGYALRRAWNAAHTQGAGDEDEGNG